MKMKTLARIGAGLSFTAFFLGGVGLLAMSGFRLSGDYVILTALGLFFVGTAFFSGLMLWLATEKWAMKNPADALDKPDPPFNLPLSPDQYLYYLCLFVSMLMFWFVYNLLRGRSGRAMMAIRDHPMAAGTMGIDTALYKTVTFGISAAITGVAGSLSAITIAYVAPDSFTLQLAVSFLVGLVVGGIASLPGCILGGAFIVLVQNSAQSISDWMKVSFSLRYDVPAWAIYGVLLLLLMYFLPSGLMGGITALKERLFGTSDSETAGDPAPKASPAE